MYTLKLKTKKDDSIVTIQFTTKEEMNKFLEGERALNAQNEECSLNKDEYEVDSITRD